MRLHEIETSQMYRCGLIEFRSLDCGSLCALDQGQMGGKRGDSPAMPIYAQLVNSVLAAGGSVGPSGVGWGFPGGGGPHGFVAVQMAGGHAVLTVAIAGVEATLYKDLIAAKEEEMNGGRKPGAHREIIQSNGIISLPGKSEGYYKKN